MKQQSIEITAEISTKLKVIAIVLMLFHHLFGIINIGNYLSLFSINHFPVELIVGRFAKICVAMFTFLSGYGFYCTLNSEKYTFKKNLNKILRFYLHYLVVFALFIPYGFYKGLFPWDVKVFFGNLLMISSSYNGAWWFAGVYLYILLFYPVFIYVARDKTPLIILLSIFLFSIAFVIQLFPETPFIRHIAFMKNTFIWQVLFFQGYLFAKNSWFRFLTFIDTPVRSLITICIVFLLRSMLPLNFSVFKSSEVVVADFFFGPLFIFAIRTFLKEKQKWLIGFGKHSTNLWLTHIFFQITYFSKLVFYPRFSILILLWELVLCIIASYIINAILNRLNPLFFKKQLSLIQA